MARGTPARPARSSRAWWSAGLAVLAVLLMPLLLLFQFVRTPSGLLGWAVNCLSMATLLGVVVGGRDGDGNLRIDAELPRVALAMVTALALQVLLSPEQALFLVPAALYPGLQVVAGLVLAAAGVWWWRWVRDVLLADPPVTTVADAVASSGLIPAKRRGRRRAGRSLPQAPVSTFVGRVKAAFAHRVAVLGRYLAVFAVVVLVGAVCLVVSGGAFLEAWAAFVVALVLLAEERVRTWRRENILTGFDEPDPDAGRFGYDAWWGLSAGWAVATAASASLRLGGVRPEPWWFYGVALALAVVAAVQPWRLVRAEPDRWFAAWLARRPERVAEFAEVRAAWPASRRDEFGELPAVAGYAAPETGERPLGR